MEKLDGKSKAIVKDNIDKLKQLFPDAFTEDGIDFDALKCTLGEYVDDKEERYKFTWHGKTQSRRLAQTPSTGTLRPCKEESLNWDNTENLFIEGDNLEVLKLLQKSYHKKIKMIYIDPPYNTGKDFVYKDDFRDNIKNYKELTGQVDSSGKSLSTNSETSGRYHTDWLNMMYPRLKLARNLLKDDGVIFISIDDNEVNNLRKICDEVFGEENFMANFLWKKKSTTSNVKDAQVSAQVDYQICYQKSSKTRLKQRIKSIDQRVYPNNDNEGNYRTTVIEKKDSGSYKRNTMKFEILGHFPREGKRWQIGKESAIELEKRNRFIWDGEKILLKIYEFEDGDTFSAQPNLLDNHGTSDGGAKAANNELFNIPELFDNPKPIELIKHFIEITTNENDVVLDFFAGSSSTAHAVLQNNADKNKKNSYILVQLPQKTDENSEASKAGYKTIADIGKERIRRVIKKIKAEQEVSTDDTDLFSSEENNLRKSAKSADLDLGFKVFKLDASNIATWDPDFENIKKDLFNAVDNIKTDRTEEDVLYEIVLKYGLELTAPIEALEIKGKQVFVVGMGTLVVCLATDVSIEIVEEIARLKEKYQPEFEMRVVFKDSSFKDDVVKTNAVRILKQHGIEDVKSI